MLWTGKTSKQTSVAALYINSQLMKTNRHLEGPTDEDCSARSWLTPQTSYSVPVFSHLCQLSWNIYPKHQVCFMGSFIIRYWTTWKRYRGSLLGVKFNKISVALNKIFHKKSTSNWLYISSLGFKHFLPKSLSQNIVDTKLRYRHWTPNGRFNSFGWLNPQFVWRGYKILILLFTFTVQSL